MEIQNIHNLLNYSIEFGEKELQSFQQEKGLKDTKDEVVASLFRSIIELSVGAMVCAENGLRMPAEVNYRSSLESYLALKYILNDPQKSVERAKAYKVGYHLQQIETARAAIELKEEIRIDIQHINNAVKIHTDIINKPEFKSIFNEFENLKNKQKKRKKYYPAWYSLFGGPQTLTQLVKNLEDNPELVNSLYSSLSKSAHNYIAIRALFPSGLLPVRSLFDPDEDSYNLNVITTLLVSSIKRFTESIYPDYTKNLQPFLVKYIETKRKLNLI